MPSARQILGAAIRAEAASYYSKHQKPYGGGFLVPSRGIVYKHLAKQFSLTPVEISYFMTWSRRCSHSWEVGACEACPE